MMLYPGYDVRSPPHVLHYGLLWNVGDGYSFDKHWHYDFDPFLCPPWNLDDVQPNEQGHRAVKGGLFPHPPSPNSFYSDGLTLLKDLLSIEPVITLNAALCERHLAKCSPSPELERQCAKAKSLEADLDKRVAALLPGLPDQCENLHQKCEQWAMSGECSKNPSYMMVTCVKACGFCLSSSDAPVVIETDAHAVHKEQVAGRDGSGGDTAADLENGVGKGGEIEQDDREGDNDDDDAYDEDDRDDAELYEDHSLRSPADRGTQGASLGISDDAVKRLLDRCRENARTWSAQEVTKCVKLARDGIEHQHHDQTDDVIDPDESPMLSTRPKKTATRTSGKDAATAKSESAPMSLAAIIAANLTMKEKLLLGLCGSYLAWFIANRRHGGAASRLSRYRKLHRDKNDRLPVRT